MARKDIVVVGASAGGMEALKALVAGFPRNLQAAVFIVWHMPEALERSVLPRVLSQAGPLPASNPKDRDRIEPGRIYVARADHHMLIEDGFIRIAKGPKENRFRPAVDPLFRSAAYVYGPRVIGIVLSGALDDGTAGLWTVKLRGGTAIVQSPDDAMHASMPMSARNSVAVDHCLPASEIGALVGRLAREEAAEPPSLGRREGDKIAREIGIAEEEPSLEKHIMEFGDLSPFTCPECHGVLTRLQEGKIIRFRCHTGHAYTSNSLLASVTEQVEARLWDALRAVDETVMLLSHMGQHLAESGDKEAGQRYLLKAKAALERTKPIRELAMHHEPLSTEYVDGVGEIQPERRRAVRA